VNGPLPPPGACEAVAARCALVVAPHYDDEVLGCGGLLARLVRQGAAVHVLFLTDGAGGEERGGDAAERARYAAERRKESEGAARVLGLTGAEHLGLPDGGLTHEVERAAAAIGHALLELRPDLVLAPSPLEATADHRAACAALHRAVAAVRAGDPLAAVLADLRVLLYEINHPGYPDLLVDASAEVETLERAMACYASQERRHPYLQAALGLRRFRALSLPPGPTAVEGYRRLAAGDLTTRSWTRLVRDLGGVAVVEEVREGPKISVVVRTKDRPELLAEALASLAVGAYRRVEVVLVNDGGGKPAVAADFPLPVVAVDLPQNRGRAAAANAGIAAASGDFVAFLDDDDLVEPEHLATLAGLVGGAGVRVAYTDAAVGVYELDPRGGWQQRERRLPYSRDFDPDLLLLDNYIPFHTLLVERRLYQEIGPFDVALPFFEDWDALIRLAQRAPFHHRRQVTCEYRHFRGAGHHVLGDRPRERGDFLAMKERVLAKHSALIVPDVLARAVDVLRAEAVELGEAANHAARQAAERRDDLQALEDRFHRLNGERAALAGERTALAGELDRSRQALRVIEEDRDRHRESGERQRLELERLYGEEAKLRAAIEEQTTTVGKLYAEIDRLGRTIRAMEQTRAWRLHTFFERHRG